PRGQIGRRPEARLESVGHYHLLVLDELDDTPDVRKLLALRRAHHGAENSAGPQIHLALAGRPGRRRPPLLDVLRIGPDLPNQRARRVDGALDGEVEAIATASVACHVSSPYEAKLACVANLGCVEGL